MYFYILYLTLKENHMPPSVHVMKRCFKSIIILFFLLTFQKPKMHLDNNKYYYYAIEGYNHSLILFIPT